MLCSCSPGALETTQHSTLHRSKGCSHAKRDRHAQVCAHTASARSASHVTFAREMILDSQQQQTDAQWWRQLAAEAHADPTSLLHHVTHVALDESRTVTQSNCVVTMYSLFASNGEQLQVAMKHVDLEANNYRDEEHRTRSLHSYQVETNFLAAHAAQLSGCGAPVAQQHAALWNDAHTQGVQVVGDLHCWCQGSSAGPSQQIDGIAKTNQAAGEAAQTAADSTDHAGTRSQYQRGQLSWDELNAAIHWLAAFHAEFWRGGSCPGAMHGRDAAWCAGVHSPCFPKWCALILVSQMVCTHLVFPNGVHSSWFPK